MQTTRNEVRQQMTTKPRRAEDESHGKSLLRPYCRHIRRHGRHEHYRGASIVTVGFDIVRIDRAVGALRSMRRLRLRSWPALFWLHADGQTGFRVDEWALPHGRVSLRQKLGSLG